jgi:Uma2 family endonuclease
MTTENLLSLPDDGLERWLIRGELKESRSRFRARAQARVTAKIGYLIGRWARVSSGTEWEVLVDAAVVLAREPDTVIWLNVAVVSNSAEPSGPHFPLFEGAPVLAVDVPCGSETYGEIADRIGACLEAGVKLAWVVDPKFRTITVYRPDAEPQLFNVTQTISGEPHLPGFQVAVADVFAR